MLLSVQQYVLHSVGPEGLLSDDNKVEEKPSKIPLPIK